MVRFLCVLVASAALTGAMAQDAFDMHASNFRLLTVKQVQDELKVTKAQRDRMNAFADQHRKKLQEYEKAFRARLAKDKSARPDATVLQRHEVTLRGQVLRVLSATQLRRLREVSLQGAGVAALLDDKVAQRVGLSASQLKTMRDAFTAGSRQAQEIQQSAAKPIMDKYKDRKPKDQKEAEALQKQVQGEMRSAGQRIAPRLQAIQKRVVDRMQATMSAEQRQRWQALLGKPFRPS